MLALERWLRGRLNRINDHHLTLDEKNAARGGIRSGTGREQP